MPGAQGLPSRNLTTLGCSALPVSGEALCRQKEELGNGGWRMDGQTDHSSISLAEEGCCPPLPAL